MTKLFECDGVVYGPVGAIEFRNLTIRSRDEALKANDFDMAVMLSHFIALFSMMAEHIWGDEWRELLLK